MIKNKDFAMLYAGRTVFNKNGGYAGVVVGWNDRRGVILGVDHMDGWSVLEPSDVVFKECESYWYASINDLID